MKITNKYGIPSEFLVAAHMDSYTRGMSDVSVTELIGSPAETILKRVAGNAERDLRDQIFSMMGTAMHKLLADTVPEGTENIRVEERLFHEMQGLTVSGQIDRLVDNGKDIDIYDYKMTSVAQYKKVEALATSPRLPLDEAHDWIKQTNMYAALATLHHKKPVRAVYAVVIMRDWSKMAALKSAYPDAPVKVIKLPLYPMRDRKKYFEGKVRDFIKQRAEYEMTGELTPCALEDRWGAPDFYKVQDHKYATIEEANARIAELRKLGYSSPSLKTEFKAGQHLKCEHYCEVSHMCPIRAERLLDIKRYEAAMKMLPRLK